jgi:hypothetical protein
LEHIRLILKIVAINLVLAGVLVFVIDSQESPTHTNTFCAYGKVFVEFKNGRNTWGTLLLDRRGLPILCKEEIELKEQYNNLPSENKGFNI